MQELLAEWKVLVMEQTIWSVAIQEAWAVVEPIFRDTAVENGYIFTGKAGGGHFLKMVHNGIEYGMMAAIGEGFEILKKVNLIMTMKK